MNVEDILAEREKTHGDYEVHASCTQALKRVVFNSLRRSGREVRISATQQEALDMICHKIGRIVAGDPNHKDHWDDIAGYATLVSKILASQQPPGQSQEIRSSLTPDAP